MLRRAEDVRNEFRENHGVDIFNSEICGECKGKGCCQHFPCYYAPYQFQVFVDNTISHHERVMTIVGEIEKGKISFDMITFNDQVYGPLDPETLKPDFSRIQKADGFLFLRARARDGKVADFQYFMDGIAHHPCINWSLEEGCSLSNSERPYTGQMLIPKKGRCIDLVDDWDFMYAWADLEIQWSLYEAYRLTRYLDN